MKSFLTRNGLRVKIDDKFYNKLIPFNWSYATDGKTKKYVFRTASVAEKAKGMPSKIYLHRVILGLINRNSEYEADHINGDTLDNRLSNLRKCTHSDNTKNKKKYKNNTSGYRGVTWNKHMKKWCATITADGETYRLGTYSNRVLAAKAYNAAAIKYHGDYANLNKIKSKSASKTSKKIAA